MPHKHDEMSSTDCISAIGRWERKVLKEMMEDARRPALINWYNHHPEILDDLIERAQYNLRFTPPTSQIKRFYQS